MRGLTVKAVAGAVVLMMCATPFKNAEARSINDALGKTTFSWLKAAHDAEIAAGGETMAARDGHAGLLVHPAAIAGLSESTLKLSYVSHYVDTQFGTIGYARRVNGRDLGVRISYVNYGEFVRTDRQGQRLGTFSAGDIGLSFNVARQLREDLKVGAMLSYYSSKLDDFSAQAVAADFGLLYNPPFQGLTVGATLMNLGTVTKSYSSDYTDVLPLTFVAGARKELSHAPITLMADAIFPNDSDIAFAFGIELNMRDTFFIRAGSRSRSKIDTEIMKANTDYSGIQTFGFGVVLQGYRFNYAFCPDDALEDVHKATLSVSIP